MQKSLVSVIIVNWNGGIVFEECLASLSKITYPNWELIIVDNGSTDGSDLIYKKFSNLKNKSRLIKNAKNVGFAKANNKGYEKSTGEFILLLNNDTKVEKDFLIKMVNKLESDPTVGVIQPKIYLMDQPNYLDNAGSFFTLSGFLVHWGFGQHDSGEFNKEQVVFSVKGACLLTKRKIIEKVGLFDSDFVSYFEETDFCHRVWLLGLSSLYFPKTFIKHKVGYTSKKLDVFSVNYQSLKNRILSMLKNLSITNLMFILPIHVTILLGILLFYLLRFQLSKAKMIVSALIWNFKNLGNTLKKRNRIQKLRQVDDSYIFQKTLKSFNLSEMVNHFKKVEANF